MIYTDMTKQAMKLCFAAHKEQTDKSGLPYVFHPFHLAEQMPDEESTVVALLHDVMEDTPYTREDLARLGFPQPVLEALQLLTHDPSVTYLDYVAKLKSNPIARRVKLADLRHNSDLTRLDHVDDKARQRVKRYKAAIEILDGSPSAPLSGAKTVAPKRYIAFDVETPNYANDRMSALGITVVEDGAIVDEFDSLINPETYFDAFNVQLTGITPEMAEQAPTFPELWKTIEPILSSGLLIAHNAAFDMSVLAKCLCAYGISWRADVAYACTCQMGRRCYPQLPNHKLNTLCTYLDIPLDHHRAGSDSRACAELLVDYLDHGVEIQKFLRCYDLLHIRTKSERRSRNGI